MTTKTNYRAALEAMPDMNWPEEDRLLRLEQWEYVHREKIRKALLIAERVESEPSEAMVAAARKVTSGTKPKPEFYSMLGKDSNNKARFKSMRDQLLAEVDAELAATDGK